MSCPVTGRDYTSVYALLLIELLLAHYQFGMRELYFIYFELLLQFLLVFHLFFHFFYFFNDNWIFNSYILFITLFFLRSIRKVVDLLHWFNKNSLVIKFLLFFVNLIILTGLKYFWKELPMRPFLRFQQLAHSHLLSANFNFLRWLDWLGGKLNLYLFLVCCNSTAVWANRGVTCYTFPHGFQQRVFEVLAHHVHIIVLEVLPVWSLCVYLCIVLFDWAQIALVIMHAWVKLAQKFQVLRLSFNQLISL